MNFFLSLSLSILFVSNCFSQGLNLATKEDLAKFKSFSNETFGFAESLPGKYSLEKYVPPIQQQVGQTCVGWASLYYALSTMYNQKFNITSPSGKLANAFDPNFIYSIMQNDQYTCNDGTYMNEHFDLMVEIGAKKLLFNPHLECDSSWSNDMINNVKKYSGVYAINEWLGLSNDNINYISIIKETLNSNYPLLFGMETYDSFFRYSESNPNGITSDGIWNPRRDPSEAPKGGHSMCVIGYDDNFNGGSFKIVNSWGRDFGDKGYAWIKYTDFKEFVNGVYKLELKDNLKGSNSNIELEDENYIRFSGGFGNYEGQGLFESLNGIGILFSSDYNTYAIGQFINNKKEGHFILIDNQEMYSSNYRDDVLIDINAFGFSGDNDETDEKHQYLKDYLISSGFNYALRKSKSNKN